MKTKSKKSTTTIFVASSFSVPSSNSNVVDTDVRSVIIIIIHDFSVSLHQYNIRVLDPPPLWLCF